MSKTYTEKRFFEWHEDDTSVTLRSKSGSYGGGREVFIVQEITDKDITIHSFDARGNDGGCVCCTITGDHEDRITGYTAIVVITENDGKTDQLGGWATVANPYEEQCWW